MNDTIEFSSEVVGKVTSKVWEAIEKIDVESIIKEVFKETGSKMRDINLDEARETIEEGLSESVCEFDFNGINESICEFLENMTE